MDNIKIVPSSSGFDYINSGDPTVLVNPDSISRTWLNITSGEIFTCIDNTIDANIWQGQLGTKIF